MTEPIGGIYLEVGLITLRLPSKAEYSCPGLLKAREMKTQ